LDAIAESCAPELLARRKALAKKQAARVGKKLQRFTRARPAPSLAEVCRLLGLIPERMPAPRGKVSAAAAHLGWTPATEIGTTPFDKLALPEATTFDLLIPARFQPIVSISLPR